MVVRIVSLGVRLMIHWHSSGEDDVANYSIKQLAEDPRVGMSYWELQARIVRLARLRPQWASKSGRHGRWIITEDGLEALVQLKSLEDAGMSVSAALEELLRDSQDKSAPRVLQEQTMSGEMAAKGEIIQILKERIEKQDRIIDSLLDQRRESR